MKILSLKRQWYTHDTTIGELYLPDGNRLCYTLEDSARAWGIKVKDFTCIPPTSDFFYNISVTYSERFKKELPIIYTEITDGRYLLKNGGIQFEAIRFHGGNDNDHSSGCPLVAFHFDGKDKIYNPVPNNRADDALTKVINEYLRGGTVGLKVVNLSNKL